MAKINPATHGPGGKPHPQFILDYLAAFRGANPGKEAPRIHPRGNGWVELDGDSKRPSQIVAMTAELRERIAKAGER